MLSGDVQFFAALGAALSVRLRLTPANAVQVLMSASDKGWTEGILLQSYAEAFPKLPPLTLDDFDDARWMIESSEKSGVQAIPITSYQYPRSLACIIDAPPVIYCKGDLASLDSVPGLAVVGTRKATQKGIVVARRISRYFAEKEWAIVSGLALGIDTAAHTGALEASGRTIAVLAHGLGTVYPKQNQYLAEEILAHGGLLLSEYPVGYSAKPEQFVLRNRIQIGLSAGSVIVEGEEKSGTKTQAEYCLRNKRHLFAVLPHDKENSLGLLSSLPINLVSERGAVPIYSRNDYDKIELLINSKRRQLLEM